PNWKRESLSLSDYQGEPVVVIFFLGGGCLHCVEQLTAFGPWAEQFAEAGIQILAVSTDPVEVLTETFALEEKPAETFPIPIVSDYSLKVFREWGVMDEFDDRAIHGTFVISPDRNVIWSEQGNAPYMHPDYLLYEANRLLFGETKAVLP
ncbi:MAG: peroxiredoxin family protein, partial [Verrucomicrobiota bacterium]